MHLQGLDLNLLVALDALLSERNVTRAAERINISQPGMSAALQKLRHHFSDPLLERVGRGMELTARGRSLADPVGAVLSQIRGLVEWRGEFEPRGSRRVFRVSATTYCCELLAPPLLSRLSEVAPSVGVQFEELAINTPDRLLDGRIDFAITINARLLDRIDVDNELLRSRRLFVDELVVAIAKGSAHVGDSISLDELCERGYVETRFGGVIEGLSERLWRQQPRQPQVRGWLPNFQLTMDVVGRTESTAILPSLLVELRGDVHNVRSLPVPFELPALEERLYWHRRNDGDPGFGWMIALIEDVARGLPDRTRLSGRAVVDQAA